MVLRVESKLYKKQTLILLSVLAVALLSFSIWKERVLATPMLPVKTQIFSKAVIESNFRLNHLTLGGTGRVYGAYGKALHRIDKAGQSALKLYTFQSTVSAIHERADGVIVVASDDDIWDVAKPCKIFRSMDSGKTFQHIKTIEGGAALWWSITSDAQGRLFVAEYGPQEKDVSKTLWRSEDDGDTWQAIYKADNEDGVHLHRVAIDP
ncbi:MAG: hypothetical protein V3V09_04430, partial [Arenicellales bacterium]